MAGKAKRKTKKKTTKKAAKRAPRRPTPFSAVAKLAHEDKPFFNLLVAEGGAASALADPRLGLEPSEIAALAPRIANIATRLRAGDLGAAWDLWLGPGGGTPEDWPREDWPPAHGIRMMMPEDWPSRP